MEVEVNGHVIKIPLAVEAEGGAAVEAYVAEQLAQLEAAPARTTKKRGS